MFAGDFRRNLERIQIESELIQVVEDLEKAVQRAYTAHGGTSQDLRTWLDWGQAMSLVTHAELEVWRRALKVRNDILGRDEHDRTFDSMQERITAVRQIVKLIGERQQDLPPGGLTNVIPLKQPD